MQETLSAGARLTPHDVARIRSVADVAISPDGKWVAYTLSVPRQPLVDEDGGAWTELPLLRFAGGHAWEERADLVARMPGGPGAPGDEYWFVR